MGSLVPNHHNGSDFPCSGGKGERDVDDAMKAGDRPSVASMLVHTATSRSRAPPARAAKTGPGRGRSPRDATLPFQLTQRQTPRHAEGTHVSSSLLVVVSRRRRVWVARHPDLAPPPPYPRYFWPLFVCIPPRHPGQRTHSRALFFKTAGINLEANSNSAPLKHKEEFHAVHRRAGDQSSSELCPQKFLSLHPCIEMAAKSSSNASSTRRYPTRSGSTPAPESNSTWPDPDPNNATTVTSADGAVPVGNNADTAVPTNGTSTVVADDTNNVSAPVNKLPAIPEGSTTEPAVPTAANDVPVVDATPVEQSNTSNQDQQANNTAAPVDTPPVTAPAPPAVVAVTVPTPPAVVDTPSARHDDFPPLASPGREVMESHADKRKKNKEKGKAKAKAAAPTAEPDLVMLDAPPAAAIARDYDEEADRNRGHARSLGLQTDVDAVGASSSRRAATTHATPDSPPKRQRADTAGRAIPTRGGGGGDAERPAARRRYYGTVDQLPPRGNFTPVPRGGFNRPVGITSRSLYRNLPSLSSNQLAREPAQVPPPR
ncbi:hypothetical protein B0H11DRAFT_2264274 [Mycena galericulata]|nr:hypothetical protein B0H11DRAFT_2264274 [Mycena galericulata]